MLVLKTINHIQNHLSNSGKTVGFVPTMGALHQGHISLIEKARNECELVVASIFVNPTQFNVKADLDKYPITIEADMDKLIAAGCDVLFLPEVEEIYPTEESRISHLDLGYLNEAYEAAARPGHFDGVAIVVKRLLDIVRPDKLYMGQKDFQQFLVVRKLIEAYNMKVDLVRCPIVREPDGLAMSSRNVRLTGDFRTAAGEFNKQLFRIKENTGKVPLSELVAAATEKLNSNPLISVSYLDAVDGQTLLPVQQMTDADEVAVVAAIDVDGVHLLDNVIIS